MTPTEPDIIAAHAEAASAKRDLVATLGHLQRRLQPANVAKEALSRVRERADAVAEKAAARARARPALTAGMTAAVAALILHRPLLRLARRIFRRDETESTDRRLSTRGAAAPRPTRKDKR